jgi:quercetin 2,3-dioxygenase
MITLRSAKQRYDDRRGKLELWLTFYMQAADDPLAEGFGGLAMLNEGRIPPGGTVSGYPHGQAELITYVLSGTLALEDSLGRSALIQAGGSRCMTGAPGVRSSETNPSRTAWTHFLQIGLRSEDALVYSASLEPGQHLAHDLRAGRRAWLYVVSGEVTLADVRLASGDGVGITSERSVSLTASTGAEILLFDVS